MLNSDSLFHSEVKLKSSNALQRLSDPTISLTLPLQPPPTYSLLIATLALEHLHWLCVCARLWTVWYVLLLCIFKATPSSPRSPLNTRYFATLFIFNPTSGHLFPLTLFAFFFSSIALIFWHAGWVVSVPYNSQEFLSFYFTCKLTSQPTAIAWLLAEHIKLGQRKRVLLLIGHKSHEQQHICSLL